MELPLGLSAGLKRILLFGLLLGCAGGCRSWHESSPPPLAPEPARPSAGTLSPSSLTDSDAGRVREVLASARLPAETGLGASAWTRRPAGAEETASRFGWRYPALDAIIGRPASGTPDWETLAKDPDPIVAANAAMGLARLGRAAPAGALTAAVRDPTLPFEMRCAAAESLGAVDTPEATEAIRELITQYGDYTPKGRSTYLGELHAELIRGLASRVDPCRDEMVLAAIRSPQPRVRLEAVAAVAASEPGELPRAAADARLDGDAAVRAAAIRAIVRHEHPKRLEYAARALRDMDRGPREAAIESLACLNDPESLALLETVMTDGGELDRAAAVAAFAARGAKNALFAAAKDKSARVRIALAKSLGGCPGPEAEEVARGLLSDPSGQVRAEVVAGIANWPLRQAGPILLDAMALRTTQARHAAASRLADQWPPALEFPVDADAAERDRALAVLRARYAEEVGFPSAVKVLRETAPKPASLEELAAAAELASADAGIRQSAARTLAALAVENRLQPGSVAALVEIALREDDPLFWQAALEAVAKDGSADAARLARAGLGHPVPDVRRRACVYLAAHPNVAEAPFLLPLLQDKSAQVASAAIIAIGACGPDCGPAVVKGLESLLGGGDEMLRTEAAAVLASWDVPSGMRALDRAALSEAPSVRQRAAEAMGESADPAFLPYLIRLLDDRQHIRVAALAALSKTLGDETAGIGDMLTVTEKVTRWKIWYEKEGGTRTADRAGSPPKE